MNQQYEVYRRLYPALRGIRLNSQFIGLTLARNLLEELMSNDKYDPRPEHKFSFGLWTLGNRGRDPFGDAVRPSILP